MASGSGQDIKDSVYGPREESNDAATAADAAEPPPPPPPPALSAGDLQGRVHERLGEEGGSPSPATAAETEVAPAAAADRKGKKVAATFYSPPTSPSSIEGSSSLPIPHFASSAGGSYPPASPVITVSGGEESIIANAVYICREAGARVSWQDPLVDKMMTVRKVGKQNYLESVYEDMLQVCVVAEEMAKQVKPPVIVPEKKKSLWSKVKSATKNMVLRISSGRLHDFYKKKTVTRPHVNRKTTPMVEMLEHYQFLVKVAREREIISSHALLLHRDYSEFRSVLGDGECFYRSFIFSYLEQVLDRQDWHEEHRLLAAVKEVARQHARLPWISQFSKKRKAFKKMIKKVMRWKRQSRWKPVPTTNSYRKEKLLDFFSGYPTTRDIFAFLRMVAAIWICSHQEEYEPHVVGLSAIYTLEDWCFREVIPERIDTDHIQMTALVTALGVPLRVENLFEGRRHDLYTGQALEDNMSGPDHEVPSVTVLFTNSHYDIIYPHRRDMGARPSIDESYNQVTDPGESSTAAGQTSSQQITQTVGGRLSQEIEHGESSSSDSCRMSLS